MAIEKVQYSVIEKSGNCELRDYDAYIVAETEVNASMEDASGIAFRRLFNFISGNNRSREKIAMTSPVSQEPGSEKIAMTSPVGQQQKDNRWLVTFAMPSEYTMQTIPQPVNPEVKIRQIPAMNMAAIRYSGRWTESSYSEHLARLKDWIVEKDLKIAGQPVWARYNPPFTPWFMRRNEILIPVRD